MTRHDILKTVKKNVSARSEHFVSQRLDESLPLQTEQWAKVEQVLMRLTEFAPTSIVTELVNAVALYADDQARRSYLLGQDDFAGELKQVAERVA